MADPAAVEPSETLETREVLEAVADLPPEYREAVVAVDLAGLSYREAARALGVRQGTIMSRLHRGRREVASRLSPG
jgi:RNA polymerase sigma-70 factor, ECF subfamily